MRYATVMVYVDADAAPARLRLAAGVADKFNATLIGMAALAIRPAFVADGAVVQDLMQSDIKEMRGMLAERGSWFRTIVAADHRKLEWRTVLDFPNDRSGMSAMIWLILPAADWRRDSAPAFIPIEAFELTHSFADDQFDRRRPRLAPGSFVQREQAGVVSGAT
jgi:hypothetical protein